MKAIAVPYLRASLAASHPWQLARGDELDDLPEHLEGWDPNVDLEVRRHVHVDGATVSEQCGLGADATVRLVAGWRSEPARARSYPYRHPLLLPANFEGTVSFVVPGDSVAASVTLVVGLVLIHPGKNPSKLAARIPGSWLWGDQRELRLEQTRGRFPMEWTDFAASGLPAEAPWFLDWPNQDWEAPLLGSLRLKLNGTNAAMSRLLEFAEEDPRRRLVVRSAILDVAKQMVIAALCSEEFAAKHAHFPSGSVGACVLNILATAFPGTPPATTRTQMLEQAGAFHLRLQAALVPFVEVLE